MNSATLLLKRDLINADIDYVIPGG